MPVKRKRAVAGGDGKTEEHEGSPIPVPSHSKRRKKNLQYDSSDICHELYEIIRNYKDEDGRMTCESFIRAPKRRTTADYYDVVSTPIDLLKIQQKIKTDEYEDVEQMTVDVELLVNNAKTYYKKHSQEYKDACDLWDLYIHSKDDLLSDTVVEKTTKKSHHGDTTEEEEEVEKIGEDLNESNQSTASSSSKPVDPEDLETLFTAVMKAKDGEREISEIFQLLPSKTKYPEYYEIIKDPIDLKKIASRIQENHYKTLDELEKDLQLMIRNAKSFNEPKSLIYKDACTIKKIILAKKTDIEAKRCGQVKTSERLRTRERGPVKKLSAICAALKYNSDDEEVANSSQDNSSQLEYDDDSGTETTILEDENPLQQLFSSVRNFTTQNGDSVAEPFLKLPNRRFYPDYYEEIKRPLSLFNIRKKLGHKHYKTLDELANDINLVLENAKQYNTENSLIYKNAVFLQRLMVEKKKELEKSSLTDYGGHQYRYPSITLRFDKELWEEEASRSKPRKSIGPPDSEKKRSKGRSPADESHLKRRLNALYKSVYEYVDNGGRALRGIFMELPSKKDYPSYYQVIMQPIDMALIDMKIKGEKYQHESQLIADFELMFSNARHFNEEGSQVYKDADTLERVLKNKYRFLCQQAEAKKSQYKRARAKVSSPLSQKLQDLYEYIRDLADVKGRNLVSPFIKLPLKADYAGYYDIIKKPIDLQKIQQKMVMSQYDALEDMVADFLLMFDNACKFNECDSTIYKDALTLQRACLEKKVELTEEGNNDPPDVRAFVQELITNLFISTFNFQDEEGRCYSDSFAELPERDPQEEGGGGDKPKLKPLTFDQIKRNIDKQRYRRVDRFQEDMFSVFDRARRLSRTDSQVYEDAVEMQMFFLKIRDELCKNGEILLTPAMSYTEKHLQAALTSEKHEKLPLEQKEDEEKRKQQESEDKNEVGNMEEGGDESVKFKEETYHVGDFVYIEPREKNLEPHIMCIEKLYKDPSGDQLIHGNWFYRPNETFHLATRKFLEKEVFKSDTTTSIPLFQVLGKCHVMFVKEYFKQKPEGFDNKHVYVCESRYSLKQRCFKKIKNWTVPKNENIKLLTREIPLVPVRVTSVFADKSQPASVIDDDGDMGILDKLRLTVPAETPSEEGNNYYEQFTIPAGSFKLGDCVYVRSDQNRTLIARIEKMWTDKSSHPFFYGPWFVGPGDVDHSPTRLFYKKEVFLSSIEDTNSMHSIIGKCSVLHMKDYCCSRPTEVPEPDAYVCESKYLEAERNIKKISKGFKKMFKLSPKVTDDEVLFFKKMNIPRKEPSPLLPREELSFVYDNEDTQDMEPDPVCDESMNTSYEAHVGKPKKVKNPNKRVPSGYIVFAGEMRKVISLENPECSFGDVSRIVGTKWRSLPKEEKEKYEARAKKLAEEQKKKREEQKAMNESLNRSPSPWSDFGKMSPGSSRPHTPGSSMPPAYGYPQGQYPGTPAQGYTPNQMMSPNAGMPPGGMPMQPMYRGPPGMPGQRPFMPPYQQGARNMGPYPNMPPDRYPTPLSMPNHPFTQSQSPYTEQPLGSQPNLLQGACDGQQMVPPPPPPRPPSPMFVTVPPRTQRLLHSEAYLKYIEGLTPEKKTITDWDKTLTATQDNTAVVDERTLPSQWLSQGAGYHGSVTDALWALRDLMLKDTLSITRTIPFEALCFQLCHNRIVMMEKNTRFVLRALYQTKHRQHVNHQ